MKRQALINKPFFNFIAMHIILCAIKNENIRFLCHQGLQSIIAVTAKREIDNKVTEETRYFISSLGANDPKRLEFVVRAHWSIENNLHWVLDIAFDEDSNRTRKGHSAANLAVIRHIALNSQGGRKIKRLKAGWDNDYLLRVIGII